MAIIYYTGKEKLTPAEKRGLEAESNGNIIILGREDRPKGGFVDVSTTIILNTVGLMYEEHFDNMSQLPLKARNQWCILYCGGSKKIKEDFIEYSKKTSVKFEVEQFNW